MKQKFNYRALPMLIAALTVADNFDSEKEVFIEEIPSWNDPFIADFRAAVQQIMEEYYGISSKEELQHQTQVVNELEEVARTNLAMVKTQIERGFRSNPERGKWMLAKLGYKEYWPKASNRSQTMLIGLLLAFRNNLDDLLRAELEQAQVNMSRLDNILMYSNTLHQANITQESLKGSSKIKTEEAVIALNDVYARAIDICAIGKQLFRKDKLKKDLFVFSKLVKQQGTASNKSTAETESATTEIVDK
jgi:hypothetical protein